MRGSVEDRDRRRRSGSSFGAGVLFLVGLCLGVALAGAAGVFLLGLGLVAPAGSQEAVADAPSPTPSVTALPGTAGSGNVPDPCVRAARYNKEVEETVDGLAEGTQQQDARVVQEALDRLQGARENARGASEECLALAGEGGTVSPSPEPSPSATR